MDASRHLTNVVNKPFNISRIKEIVVGTSYQNRRFSWCLPLKTIQLLCASLLTEGAFYIVSCVPYVHVHYLLILAVGILLVCVLHCEVVINYTYKMGCELLLFV